MRLYYPLAALTTCLGFIAGCSTSDDGSTNSGDSTAAAGFDPSQITVAGNANVDTNNDGVLDGVLVDTNGDGVGDVVVVDTNGDGIGDATLLPQTDGSYVPAPMGSAGAAGTASVVSMAGTGGGSVAMAGAAAGGSPGAGGTPGTGGTTMAQAGSGGTPPMGDTPVPSEYARGMSPGCGKALPLDQEPGANNYKKYVIASTQVDQAWLTEFNKSEDEYMDRNYKVSVPLDYDPNHPYTVNIMGGGCGGSGDDWGGLSAWRRDDNAYVIFVHPNYKGGCYQDDGVNNPEWAFMNAWWPEFLSNYCVDLQRVFITGWSSGGWESYTMGCGFAGTIRGIGPATGGQRERRNECQGPVAAIMAADAIDGANPIHDTVDNSTCTGTEADGCWMGKQICTGSHLIDNSGCVDEGTATGRDLVLERNGCVGTETVPWGGTIDDIPLEEGGIYRYPTFMHTDPGDVVPQADIDKVKDYFPVPEDGINNIPACHKYVGCPEQFPVVWCMTYDDGHSPESRISERQGDDGRSGYQRFFEDEVPNYPQ